MSFNLKINFTGLCMFVPDHSAKKMHVFLPGHADHLTRVYYDKAHCDAKATTLSGEREILELNGNTIDFSGLGVMEGKTPTFDAALPAELFDFNRFLNKTVDAGKRQGGAMPGHPHDGHAGHMEHGAGAALSRITLNSGHVACTERGVQWDIQSSKGNYSTNMAWWLKWEIPGIELSTLALTASDAAGVVADIVRVLQPIPIDDTNTIELFVYNAPPEEHPPAVLNRGSAFARGGPQHFEAYAGLYNVSDVSRDLSRISLHGNPAEQGVEEGSQRPGKTCAHQWTDAEPMAMSATANSTGEGITIMGDSYSCFLSQGAFAEDSSAATQSRQQAS